MVLDSWGDMAKSPCRSLRKIRGRWRLFQEGKSSQSPPVGSHQQLVVSYALNPQKESDRSVKNDIKFCGALRLVCSQGVLIIKKMKSYSLEIELSLPRERAEGLFDDPDHP